MGVIFCFVLVLFFSVNWILFFFFSWSCLSVMQFWMYLILCFSGIYCLCVLQRLQWSRFESWSIKLGSLLDFVMVKLQRLLSVLKRKCGFNCVFNSCNFVECFLFDFSKLLWVIFMVILLRVVIIRVLKRLMNLFILNLVGFMYLLLQRKVIILVMV